MFLPLKFNNQSDELFGQMLCYSVHADFFELMGEDILDMNCYLADVLNSNLPAEMKRKRNISIGLQMSNFRPLISIVIPVYNGSDYMREAIDSALCQTYGNIEVLVINDGSSDGGETERIALSYGDRIRYFSKPNGGVASALNMGILEMRGDYFSWLSHDDLYVPEKVERQVAYLSELGDRGVVVYSDYVNVDEHNNELYPVRMDHALLSKKPLYAVFRGALHGCTLLIPRSAFVGAGIFNDLRTTQDYDLWFRMIRKHRFVHMPEILVRSRLHPNQGSRSIDATAEANELWIRMMKSLTHDEVLSLETSESAFYEGMVAYLAATPYAEALNFARERAAASPLASGADASVPSSRFSLRQYGKKKLKALLIRMGVWGHVQRFRARLSPSGGGTPRATPADDGAEEKRADEQRAAAIFATTSKILQRVAGRD